MQPEDRIYSKHPDALENNFDIVMQQIQSLKDENQELKQMVVMQQQAQTLPFSTRGTELNRSKDYMSHLSLKSLKSLSKHQSTMLHHASRTSLNSSVHSTRKSRAGSRRGSNRKGSSRKDLLVH